MARKQEGFPSCSLARETRSLTLKERWQSWPIAVRIVVVVLFVVVVTGCVSVDVAVSESECNAVHPAVQQGSRTVPLRLVHAVQDQRPVHVVNTEPSGTDGAWRCSVHDLDL